MRILACLILAITFFVPQVETEEIPLYVSEQTCNARYGFCINYPEEEFPYEFNSDNNDGIILQSKDKKVGITVAGMRKAFYKDTYDIYDELVGELIGNIEEGKIFSKEIKKDSYETYFTDGHHHYFQKLIIQDDNYIIYQIEAPTTLSFRIPLVKEKVRVSFRA